MLAKIKLIAEWVFDQFIYPLLAPLVTGGSADRKTSDDSITGDKQ